MCEGWESALFYSCIQMMGYEAVMDILYRNIDTEVRWDEIKRLDTIGLDEISLKKGHGDFVTIVRRVWMERQRYWRY